MMKLETMQKRRNDLESKIKKLEYLYSNVYSPSTQLEIDSMKHRLYMWDVKIKEAMKTTPEYKQYLELKKKFAQYGLS